MREMHFFIFAYVSFVTVVFNSYPGGPRTLHDLDVSLLQHS